MKVFQFVLFTVFAVMAVTLLAPGFERAASEAAVMTCSTADCGGRDFAEGALRFMSYYSYFAALVALVFAVSSLSPSAPPTNSRMLSAF